MTSIERSLLIASAIVLTAVAAVFDLVPAAFAEFAPLMWLAFVPWTLAGQQRECRIGGTR